MNRRPIIALVLLAVAWAADVRAEGGDRVAAEAVFQEGRRLMAAGKYAEACPKFETSQRLDPGVGTLLNLADCYEKVGRTATAWATFLEAASGSKAAGSAAREKAARDRAAALAGRLSKITIVVQASREVPGMLIKRDGVNVDRALWGSAIPVDPGTRSIEVGAPGRKSWSTTLEVPVEKGDLVVNVPQLETGSNVAPAQAAGASTVASGGSSEPDKHATTGGGSKVLLGIGILGLGAAGVVVGSVFGLAARSKWQDAKSHCPVGNACYDEAFPLAEEARSNATLSTVAFAVGAAGLAVGTIVVATSPSKNSDKSASLGVRASLDPARPGVGVYGDF